MAQDTSVINGVSTESLASMLEAAFAILVGIGIGVYYQWQLSCACLLMMPFMALGGALNAKLHQKKTSSGDDNTEDANLLAGDAINNYRTVASFANEEAIVKKYEQMVTEQFESAVKQNHIAAVAFGFSQFVQFAVFAGLFYAGAMVQKNVSGVDPEDVFVAIFSMMFGATQAGQAQQFGPDVGKATAAAKRVFKVMEQPSEIDALEMDVKNDKRRLDSDKIEGKIEFKNVWFRYPTRKSDWVLRGLNLTINAKETVALVGESGCGKSTFVSLLMRFYDVDMGEILLDGVNIQEYNLHDLRRATGMVMQEPVLFNYSVFENILYGKQDAKNSEILNAAEVANAMEFIRQIKNGETSNFDSDSAEELLNLMKAQEFELIQ